MQIVYFSLPGGMGIGFMKQFSQSVYNSVVGPAFSFDQGILKSSWRDADFGGKNTSQWSKDIDNATNKKFVNDFQSEYERLPSQYSASQGYDTGKL